MSQPLDSRQLKAFTTLARTGSFTLAAKELFLSQSAVSHSMKALENDVGCRLFDRLGKKVLLTQAGEQFLRHADQIIGEMEEARASLQEMGRWGRGRIRVGASQTVCQYVLPGILRKLRDSFAKCFVTVESGDSPALLELLKENHIDLAFCLEPSNEEHIEFHPLFADELFFLAPPSHPWAAAGRVHRDEIALQDYIFYNKGSLTYRAIEQYFQKEDIVPRVVMHVGNMETIKELVKAGSGLTIAPLWIARREIEDKSIAVLPLGKRKLKRNWGLSHRRGRRLTLPEESFLSLCRAASGHFSAPDALEAAAQA